MDEEKIREYFPILNKKIKGKPIIYLDSACMSLKPKPVIDAMNEYYLEYTSCGERSSHSFGRKTTERMEKSRERVKKFFNAKNASEIVFTKNTTESINLIARSLGLKKGDKVLTTDKEHNSNLVPWLQLEKIGVMHEVVEWGDEFDIENFKQKVKNAKLVSFVHTSNLDGTTIPAKEIIKTAHDSKALVMLDAAQSAPHKRIDVQKLDVDFLACSGHKMLGPTGVGVLYAKKNLLEKLEPFITGGETVQDSTYDSVKFREIPYRFEAGLQNYAGIIAFKEALDFLDKVGMDWIQQHDAKLNEIVTKELNLPKIKLLGPNNPELRGSIFSFNIDGMGFHEVASMLDETSNIMIRSGNHCVHSWFNAHGMKGSARASWYLYNTEDEILKFAEEVKKLIKLV
jgi:cysteine desulfurase/selenocysteine lyase